MNVKQGDLAIVIKAKNEKNLGKILQVLQWRTKGYEWDMMGQKFVTEIGGWECAGNIFMHGNIYPFGVISDDFLRPVSGLPDTEHTDEREPIKELA